MADPMQFRRAGHERECPICGHRGRFWSHGTPPRGEAMCPRCLSLERHRLMHLLIDRHGADLLEGKRVLHFAPESCIRERLARMSDYVTADISRSEEHTSELQSLMRNSYAVLCFEKKKKH